MNQYSSQKIVILGFVKLRYSEIFGFFTQTFDSLKIFPKFNLHWIVVRSMYLHMLFTRRGFPLIITLLQF